MTTDQIIGLVFACLSALAVLFALACIYMRREARWWRCAECGCYFSAAGNRVDIRPRHVVIEDEIALCGVCGGVKKHQQKRFKSEPER